MELILGGLVSAIVQVYKNKFKTGEYETLLIVAILSIGVAGMYTVFVQTGIWENLYQVLITAGAVYTFILQRFEK